MRTLEKGAAWFWLKTSWNLEEEQGKITYGMPIKVKIFNIHRFNVNLESMTRYCYYIINLLLQRTGTIASMGYMWLFSY